MGCFDTVYFECPKCHEHMTDQSKSGDCNMGKYHMNSVPARVIGGLTNKVHCMKCNKDYDVIIPRVALTLREATSDNERPEWD